MNTSSSPPDSRTGDEVFVRWVAIVFVFPILLIASYFISQIPYLVTSYRQLGCYANGKRVRFDCRYQGQAGVFGQVSFDGHPILLKSSGDSMKSRPNVGDICTVVGRPKHLRRHVGGVDGKVDYIVLGAEIETPK